jgi:hypothetical protein
LKTTESQTGLLFIPDISGFTQFVHTTEIDHSQHIISELLELIINANEMQLEVSEIEGDAVLFFRMGKPPSIASIASQVKKMFIDFHTYRRIIERDRVCQCGACSTAANLTLKFLVHFGDIAISDIKGHKKLMGRGVILVHRLLKNNITDNEYVLMTKDYILTQSTDDAGMSAKHPDDLQIDIVWQ